MSSDPAARAGALLEIDLGAIVSNWRLLAERAAPAQCAAVVKANAYGLGAAPVTRALAAAGCRLFFVATLDEGIALRAALGPEPEIAVFNGPLPGTAAEFAAHRLIPVLNEPGQITAWRGQKASPAILHVDTGMSRLGLSAREFTGFADELPKTGIVWRAIISHLACADTPDHALNEQQRARFAAATHRMPGVPASLAASSGIFLGPAYHFDFARPGAALYGVNPQPGRPNPMRQVVRLSGKILQVREIDRGESVGYGAAHVLQKPGRVAAAGMPDTLSAIGGVFLAFLAAVGGLARFAVQALAAAASPPYFPRLIARQVLYIGYYSLPVVGLTALFTGMVLALQSYTG